MKVHVVVRGDGRAVESSGLIVPAAERGFDFFGDVAVDGLHDFCLDDVALGVDRNLNDDVADEVAGQGVAIDGRIGIDDGKSNVDFVAEDGAVDDAAEGGAGLGIFGALVGFGVELMMLLGSLRFFCLGRRPDAWALGGRWREQELGVFGGIAGGQISDPVRMLCIAPGQPCGGQVNRLWTVKDDESEQGHMRRHGQTDSPIAPQPRTRRLKTGKHATFSLLLVFDGSDAKRWG